MSKVLPVDRECKQCHAEWDFCTENPDLFSGNTLLFNQEVEEFQQKESERPDVNGMFMRLKLFLKTKYFLISIILFILLFIIIVLVNQV